MKKLKVKLMVDDYTHHMLTTYSENTGRDIGSIIETLLNRVVSDSNNRSTTAQNNTKSAGGLLYRAYTYWLSKYDMKFSRNDFINAFIADNTYNEMFKEYMLSGFDSKKRPSFVYHKKLKKIGIVTYAERMKQQAATNGIPIIQLSYDKVIEEFPSIKAAARETKVDIKTIRKLLKTTTTGAPKQRDFIYAEGHVEHRDESYDPLKVKL